MNDIVVKPLIKNLEQKFDKFARVVLHIDEQFGDFKEKLSCVEEKVDRLQNLVDNLTRMAKCFEEEMIVNCKTG